MKILVLLRNLRPAARLKEWIAGKFHLEKKGRKLLETGFALGGATLGVAFIQLIATLLTSEFSFRMWGWTMVPWLPVAAWAWWRFFLRYLGSKAFVCYHCGRLKVFRKLSQVLTYDRSICLQCACRNREVIERIGNLTKELDLLLGDVEFLKKHPK